MRLSEERRQQLGEILAKAVEAQRSREFYARYPEAPSPKIYGETANADGEAAFKAMLNTPFESLMQAPHTASVGEEESPYGFALGITYPSHSADELVSAARTAAKDWRRATPEERALVLIDALEASSALFFQVAYATMHTTGQGFMMAFQASGPHAWDRALEAVAQGYAEQSQFAPSATWQKQVGKDVWVTLEKSFHVVPKGVGVVIGCSTFPVWNTTPGLFAGLVTGNAMIVKPHPKAVLPIALLVASMQKTLAEHGFSPAVVQLAADSSAAPLTLALAEHPAVGTIDYTGGPAFGEVLEQSAARHGKVIFTEKAGVNSVLIDEVEDLGAVAQNIAFSLCLYSGQMCTAPQTIFIPSDGVTVAGQKVAYADVVSALVGAVRGLATHPKAGAPTLGAIQNPATAERVERVAAEAATVLLPSQPVEHPGFDGARSVTPLMVEAGLDRADLYGEELFGPISVIVPVESYRDGLDAMARLVRSKGALTTLIHTLAPEKKQQAVEELVYGAGAPVAFNFVGNIWVNQSAAFSDFHGTGANKAGNAAFADPAFVASRFNVIGVREVI